MAGLVPAIHDLAAGPIDDGEGNRRGGHHARHHYAGPVEGHTEPGDEFLWRQQIADAEDDVKNDNGGKKYLLLSRYRGSDTIVPMEKRSR
jgi:hypothetical protein